MRDECNVIRDLLPLYAENMASADTVDWVEEHMKKCEACRNEYENMKEPQMVQEVKDVVPLLKLRKKMRIKRIQTVALTVVIMLLVLVSTFAVLDAPIYITDSEEIATLTAQGSEGVLVTFDERVTNYKCTTYCSEEGDVNYYDIEAWTSTWDRWFSKDKEDLSMVIGAEDGKPLIVAYVPNDGTENICLGKYDPNNPENYIQKDVAYEAQIVLPRLILGYYLILVIAALIVVVVLRLIFRKKKTLCTWIERIGLYLIFYVIGHGIVEGVTPPSYSAERDFFLIIQISILLYGGFVLVRSIRRSRKEIKEMNFKKLK